MKLLLTSDWHLRKNSPICRKDDFQVIQKDTLKFINNLAFNKNVDKIIIAGDIFDKSRIMYAQDLLTVLNSIFDSCEIYFIPGNHDLPAHSVDNIDNSDIGVLRGFPNWKYSTDIVKIENVRFSFLAYGFKIIDDLNKDKFRICVLHRYCEEENLLGYIDNGITAKELFKKYNYDLFVVGDNHRSFVYEKDNRFVFNCGCITRQSVTEKDYKPAIYIFDTETKKYETIFLPDNDPDVIDISHIENLNKRNERIDKFINKMKDKDFEIELDFEKNLENYIKNNSIDKFVKEKINMSLED